MVSPAGSGGWQEGEVVEKQEDSEGEETNKMGPNIHRLIGADDNTLDAHLVAEESSVAFGDVRIAFQEGGDGVVRVERDAETGDG